jgi:hypothetical protein
MSMKHPLRLTGIAALLLAAWLAAGPAAAGPAAMADPWKPSPACVFAMPPAGHAVRADGTGFLPALLREVFEPAGYAFTFRPLPYDRAVDELTRGGVDCTLDVARPRTNIVRGRTTLALYDLSAAHLRTMDWRGVPSLAGERVVYQYGFDPQDLLPVAFLPQPVFHLASAFHMLDRKLAAYALDDANLLRAAMAETDFGSDQFMISPIKTLKVAPIFADTETGRALRDTYDRRMAELMDSGAVEAILRRGGLDESKLARILDAVSESLPKVR